MLIYHGIYDDLEPLKEQLKKLVEEKEFHHDCGMVGLRHLYLALDRCGLQDYAYKIITAKGFPSFMDWLEDGATTLYEHWDKKESHNHHMYSDFMSWIIKTILGIRPDIDKTGYCRIEPCPYFLEALDYAEGYCTSSFLDAEVAMLAYPRKLYLAIYHDYEKWIKLTVFSGGHELCKEDSIYLEFLEGLNVTGY